MKKLINLQIRTKLTLQFITVVAGILALALYFIYYKYSELARTEFYDHLRSKALMTAEMMLHDDQDLRLLVGTPERDLDTPGLPVNENIVIYNARLQKVFAFNLSSEEPSYDLLEAVLRQGEKRFEQGRFQALALPFQSRSGNKYVVVAESVFDCTELNQLGNILLATFVLGIAIVAVAGWSYAGQALAPVKRIIDQVDTILPANLSTRLEAPNQYDEIARLVFTFNRLLDRIQFAFRMQKSFISNVSHELKNPLSVIISQLDVALSKPRTVEEYRASLQSVLEDTRELAEVGDKLLQLARVHSDSNDIAFEWLRLDELMLQTRSSLLRLHPDYQIAFDIVGAPEHEEQLFVKANEALLRSALLNLMDNGCKFSPDKRVNVTIQFDAAGKHWIEIADNGPGIPAKDLQMIFQPFYRSSQTRHVRGSGIGLSLVDSILKLHRVALDVISVPGKGTTFRLDFPG